MGLGLGFGLGLGLGSGLGLGLGFVSLAATSSVLRMSCFCSACERWIMPG